MITTQRLRQLAGKGDPDAQFRLGYRLAFGRRRVGSAWSRAVRWWTLAAAQGHPRAQFNLGLCYLNGAGVRKNLRLAKLWLGRAASGGHKGAAKTIRDEWPSRLDESRNAKINSR